MKEIKISEVLSLLDKGLSREEIGTTLGLKKPDVSVLFKHSQLKGKKAKKQRDFVVIDDTVTEEAPALEEVLVEGNEPSSVLEDASFSDAATGFDFTTESNNDNKTI